MFARCLVFAAKTMFGTFASCRQKQHKVKDLLESTMAAGPIFKYLFSFSVLFCCLQPAFEFDI